MVTTVDGAEPQVATAVLEQGADLCRRYAQGKIGVLLEKNRLLGAVVEEEPLADNIHQDPLPFQMEKDVYVSLH